MVSFALALVLRLLPYILEVQRCGLSDGPPIDFVEFFAGEAAISRGLRAFSHTGMSFDARYHEWHNILTPIGLLAAIGAILRVREHGVVWWAPPCSTWVWVSRHSTKRTRDTTFQTQQRSRFTNKR
jgi:hypothetical protein